MNTLRAFLLCASLAACASASPQIAGMLGRYCDHWPDFRIETRLAWGYMNVSLERDRVSYVNPLLECFERNVEQYVWHKMDSVCQGGTIAEGYTRLIDQYCLDEYADVHRKYEVPIDPTLFSLCELARGGGEFPVSNETLAREIHFSALAFNDLWLPGVLLGGVMSNGIDMECIRGSRESLATMYREKCIAGLHPRQVDAQVLLECNK